MASGRTSGSTIQLGLNQLRLVVKHMMKRHHAALHSFGRPAVQTVATEKVKGQRRIGWDGSGAAGRLALCLVLILAPSCIAAYIDGPRAGGNGKAVKGAEGGDKREPWPLSSRGCLKKQPADTAH